MLEEVCGGGAFKHQSSLLARSDPHMKTMKMMMTLFKTIKVMSGAQNKVIITSLKNILPSQLEES